MIRKFLACIGLLAFVFFPNVLLAQDAFEATPKGDIQTGQSIASNLQSVYVLDFKTDKTEYVVGDTVTGSFTVQNASDFDVSELKYDLSTKGQYVNSLPTISYHSSDLMGPLYVKANEKKNISFSYTLPKTASGDLGIQVKLHMTSGQTLGWNDAFIKVSGDPIQQLVITSAYLSINDEPFTVGSGPTIYRDRDEVVVLNLEYYNPGDESITIEPSFIVNKRIKDGDVLLQESLESVTLLPEETKKIVYTLPTMDYKPGVYNATFFFMNDSGEDLAQSLNTRYIISGEDAVIENVISNRSSVSKNDPLTITVEYFGITPDLLRREAQGASNTLPGENKEADLIVKVTDAVSGELVAQGMQTINLDDNGSIPVIMNTILKSDDLVLDVQIVSKGGNVLAAYNTVVPDSVTGDVEKNSNTIFIVLSILLIIILAYLISLKKKNINTAPVVSVLILVVASLFSAKIIYAGYTPNSGYVESQWYASNYYNADVPSVFVNSPLPPSVRKYAPGEVFPLQTEIRMPYCSNIRNFASEHRINDVYNFNNDSPQTWSGPSSATDNWSHLSNWKELSLTQRAGETGFLFSSYPHNWNYTDFNAASEMFTAPQEPGIYRIYLYAGQSNQWSIGAWQSGWTAGYVEFEVEPDCEDGTTYNSTTKQCEGALTASCSFSPDPVVIDEMVTVTANISGGDGTYESISWSGDFSGTGTSARKTFNSLGAHLAILTVTDGQTTITKECPFSVEDTSFKATCSASPLEPEPGQEVTWSARIKNGTGPFTYVWTGDVIGTNATESENYSNEGIYKSNLTVTDSTGASTSAICSVNVREGGDSGDSTNVDNTVAGDAEGPSASELGPGINGDNTVVGDNEGDPIDVGDLDFKEI